MRKIIVFLSLSTLSVLWFCADILFGFTQPVPPPQSLPDVTGLTLTEAEPLLSTAQIETITRYDPSTPPGIILAQSPAPGTRFRPGTRRKITVRLTVSLGTQQNPIPQLAGSDARTAADQLRKSGFTVRESPVPGGIAGQVEKTDPAPGILANTGTEVVLFVYSGTEARTVTVPDLTSQGRGIALFRIFSEGLTAGEITEEESDAPAGTVIRQSPAPGEIVSPGTQVRLTVAKPPIDP